MNYLVVAVFALVSVVFVSAVLACAVIAAERGEPQRLWEG
jgi:hypothetical protein